MLTFFVDGMMWRINQGYNKRNLFWNFHADYMKIFSIVMHAKINLVLHSLEKSDGAKNINKKSLGSFLKNEFN